jgi:hypothetical protein
MYPQLSNIEKKIENDNNNLKNEILILINEKDDYSKNWLKKLNDQKNYKNPQVLGFLYKQGGQNLLYNSLMRLEGI